MRRREFLKFCSALSACSLLSSPFVISGVSFGGKRKYRRALLVKDSGKPLRIQDVEEGEVYLFFYPYRSTPCFLINLGERTKPSILKTEDGEVYRWEGGIGPGKSVVAFVAICTHQLSYPKREHTLLTYYPRGIKSEVAKRDRVVQCCAHLSVFEPREGCRAVDGPAKDPLPAVVLEVDGERIYATGILGRDLFEDFFDAFREELKEEYGSFRKAKEQVSECRVIRLKDYTDEIITC